MYGGFECLDPEAFSSGPCGISSVVNSFNTGDFQVSDVVFSTVEMDGHWLIFLCLV